MGKRKIRKHQKEPNDSSHSSEEEKQDQAGKSCPHILKSVSINGIKKNIKCGIHWGVCQACLTTPNALPKDNKESPDSDDFESITWLCLQCGNQGCDRQSQNQHALIHYQTPRSDKHSLVINTSDWSVWCYECDEEVIIESNKKLVECVSFIQKQSGVNIVKENSRISSFTELTPRPPKASSETNGICSSAEASSCEKKTSVCITEKNNLNKDLKIDSKLSKVKGLTNLGNTCFFNAILQNLVQTHGLTQLVRERLRKGITVSLPGMQLDGGLEAENCDKDWQLEPLDLVLNDGGALTQALASFFKDMLAPSKGGVINPNQVFGQICKKSPQFRGSKQQDSHELLRHLLDGVKAEEIKRQRAGILKAFNVTNGIAPESIDDLTRQRIKSYGRQASHTFIDNIFSGQLISTVLCKECQVSSQMFEPFLDLSLPIAEEKFLTSQPLRPGLQRKLSCEDTSLEASTYKDEKPNKYTEKKARRKAKKDAKKSKHKRSVSTNEIGASTARNRDASHSASEDTKAAVGADDEDASELSDADVEDNAESESTVVNHKKSSNQQSATSPRLPGADVAADKLNHSNLPMDSETCMPTSSDVHSPESLSGGGTSNLSLHVDNLCAHVKDMTFQEKCESKDSLTLDIMLSVTLNGCSKENLEGPEGSCQQQQHNATNCVLEKERKGGERPEGSRVSRWKFKQDWIAKSLTTLGPRYQPESHECSILSCLHQFTAPELLTGNNKFNCENCSKVKTEKCGPKVEGKKPEAVYSNASKQLLIFSPPAVLTLHLKRFQQVGYNLRKVNKHVDFTLILDLGPFCSSACLGLPNMMRGQKKVLYSLYGVVEHSGRLASGHYTAYVKIRSHLDIGHKFLNLKPAGQYEIDRLVTEMSRKITSMDDVHKEELNSADEEHTLDSHRGKWFHISDGHVSEVSEKTVLQSQAYILFYERML